MKIALTVDTADKADIKAALGILSMLAGTSEGDTCSTPDTGVSDDDDTEVTSAAEDKKAAAAAKRKAAREKKKAAEAEAEEAAEEETETETEESTGPSRDDVRTKLKEYAALEGKTAAIEILKDNGAASIGELDEENFANVIKACGS